jgi:hypothetical protein
MMQATFSDCGRFRHLLWDRWDESLPMLAWCLFNPSQAGKVVDGKRIPDPTWTKGVGFSKRLGYGGQVFCNPFDFISTEPKGLKAAGYPKSQDADAHILKACAMGDGKVVCAWGALGRGLSRPPEVLALIRAAGYQPMALGFTADGLPRHPLMLGYDTKLEPMQ